MVVSSSNSSEQGETQWPKLTLASLVDPSCPISYGILQAGPNNPGGVPYVRPADIANDVIIVDRLLRTTKEIANKHKRSELREGDIILSIVGTIGKTVIVPRSLEGANINQSAVRIRLRDDLILPSYCTHVLRSQIARRQFGKLMFGSAILRLNVADVRKIEIPVPPVNIQRIIVERIDRRITLLEKAELTLKKVESEIEIYRDSVFRSACNGTLVESERDLAQREMRPFTDAFTSVNAVEKPELPKRFKSRSQRQILVHSALAVGRPERPLPKGWLWVALTDIAKIESGHTPSRSVPAYWQGDIPWLSLSDVRAKDGSVIYDTSQHVSLSGIQNSSARVLPQGTVCLSRTASVGFVVQLGRPMATSQDFVCWTPTSVVTSAWLRVVLGSDREAFRRLGQGSTHLTVYFPELLSLYIALPPIAEQIRIGSAVDRHAVRINRLRQAVQENVRRSTLLRDSILLHSIVNLGARWKGETLMEADSDTPPRRLLAMPLNPPKQKATYKPLLETIALYPNGIAVEDLFAETGYFSQSDPDAFYRALNDCKNDLVEVRDFETQGWPTAAVKLKLKESGHEN